MLNERISAYFIRLSRPQKQLLMLLADIFSLAFAVWAAFALRLSEIFIPSLGQSLLMIVAPLLAMPVFIKVGLYRSVIRYMGEQALWSVVKGMTLAALLWAALAFMTQMTGAAGVPRSVPVIYWLLGVMNVGGIRFLARWILWLPIRDHYSGRQVFVYGAGNAGRQLALSLRQGREFFPAGFLDDDPTLQNKDVGALRVYAPAQLPKLIERFDVRDVIVAVPTVSHARRKEILAFLESHPVRVRMLPALSDIASGRTLVNSIRDVDIGDLLGRDTVAADPELLTKGIKDKSVLVTGGGGSIGSELCRQIVSLQPARLVILEANEYALYQIDRALRSVADFPVVSCLTSVRNGEELRQLMEEYGIQTVFHAAAHKHVPLVENNVLEGVRNNVFGTLSVARAAFECGVETFVLISTDKAVRPTNVMGASKRWAELVVQYYASSASKQGTNQRFSAVRFGNVLGSSGSVIPLFKEQIARGGPITVTHEEVTRYFMSIHEAVELVIQSSSLAEGGDIFLLDMGSPMKIIDLARKMIRLAGQTERTPKRPEGEIEISISGLRPGEKLYEELLITEGEARPTRHPKIMRANESAPSADLLHSLLMELQRLDRERDVPALRELLMRVALQP